MNQSLTLVFLVAAGIGLVVQNTLMVRITQSSSTILIAMLLNSLVGIVLFVSILLIKNGVAGFSELVHTLNASGLATSRLLPAIVEQFQRADGSVDVPRVLHKWLGKERLSPRA